MKNVTKMDERQKALIDSIISQVENLPEFAKLKKLDTDLERLSEFEAQKKEELKENTSALAALREKLADSNLERIEEFSKKRTRLTAQQAEIEGFINDLFERRAAITKEREKIKHSLSEKSRAIVDKYHRQEIQEITSLVAIVENRLLAWRDTAGKASMMSIGIEN